MSLTTLCAILSFSSCGSVKIKDSEFCADKGRMGAVCYTLISGTERRIPIDEWERMQLGRISGDVEAFADLKKAVIKLCNITANCSYEEKKTISGFGNWLNDYQDSLKE